MEIKSYPVNKPETRYNILDLTLDDMYELNTILDDWLMRTHNSSLCNELCGQILEVL